MDVCSPPPSGLTLPPLDVKTDPAAVARFAAALRAPAQDGVPATFPISWLASPTVRSALLSLAAPGEVAVHETQSFDYRRPLAPGRSYRLHATVTRTDAPARLLLDAEVHEEGANILTVRTGLRLLQAGAPLA